MFKKFELVKNRTYYLMALPALALIFIFSYLPFSGLQIAFKNYNFRDGIWGSAWNGIENFKFYFTSPDFIRTTTNTLWLNFNSILWGTITALILSIMLNEIRKNSIKRMFQSFIFLPYLFSFVLVSKIIILFFNTDNGMLNQIIKLFGRSEVSWYTKPDVWAPIIVFTSIWKSVGYTVVIYLATISGIDEQLFEAARLDGATRIQEIRYILIPFLAPVIFMMTLLSIGRIFYGDFQLVYTIISNNGQLYPTTDIIETYIYRSAMGSTGSGDFGMLTAVGLYQSVLGFVLIVGSNRIAKRINEDYSLF